MSTNLAYAAPLRRPREDFEPAQHPRRVQIVTTRAQRKARPKLVYAVVASAAIFTIFVVQLLLTIALSGGAYTLSDLQTQQRTLGRVSSALGEQLDNLGSTQNLKANAKSLGMVDSSSAGFLQLSTGKVLGSASPAQGAASSTALASGADDSVPNFLLATTPVVGSQGTGHGASNTGESNSSGSQSNAGGSTHSSGSSSGSSTSTGGTTVSTDPGDLPSPVTH
jgi:uncharacterized membrane protein YgcG